jgi:hypothetical protein
MTSDWAEELGDNWVSVSPGIYVHVEDLKPEPVPKLRMADGGAASSAQPAADRPVTRRASSPRR